MVKLPKLPDPDEALSIFDKASNAIDKGLGFIDKIDKKLDRFGFGEPTTTTILEKPTDAVVKGTACLPCSRDHFITTSSALSEGIRFARDEGVRSPEVLRRIRIALGELDAMERIDLAPEEMAKLKGAERELADWALRQSRDLRHAITAVRDVETMEQAAAKASGASEEFMKMMWGLPECEICDSLKTLKEYIEKRKREREAKAVE